MPTNIITRIAPTPSGYLHKGNVFNFLLTYKIVLKNNGILHLRIDDSDKPRCKKQYIDDIFNVLNLLGIDNFIGPKNTEEQIEIYTQQKKYELYKKYINKLIEKNLVYACNCSRIKLNEIPCICKTKSNDIKTPDCHLKIKVDEQDSINDFIVWRKDGIPAYQLVSVVEDHLMNCNLIVRGEDLIESTLMQKILAKYLDFNNFLMATFIHHPLLFEPNGEKLSKTAGSYAISQILKNELELKKLLQEFDEWVNNFNVFDNLGF
ncbi:MAG: glutamate--tRNA ligase family protein [Bacteroidia bacterium]